MPGFILHLAAARFYLEDLPDSDPLKHSDKFQNNFYVGNLLPDTGRDKAVSHFRDSAYQNRMLEWPNLRRFHHKYRDYWTDPVCRGYWFHLLVDKRFLQEYIPKVARFLNREGKETPFRAEVSQVELRKSGERIPLGTYLSEEYYYGDYTRMTTWLSRKYELPVRLDPVEDCVMEEAECDEVQKIMERLAGYREMVPEEAVRELRVFDGEELAEFLRQAARQAAKKEFERTG